MRILALAGLSGLLALGVPGPATAASEGREPTAATAQYPLDGTWHLQFVCGDGGWGDLVTVAQGSMSHEYEWDGGDRINIRGTFAQDGEVEINGRFVFKDHGAQRIWATGKKKNVWAGGEITGVRIDGWVKIGKGGASCELAGQPSSGEEIASEALEGQQGLSRRDINPTSIRPTLVITFGPGGISIGISDLAP